MAISSEMRESARIPIVNAVDIHFDGHENLLALAVNISLNGLFLRGTGPLPVDGDCHVAIALPQGPRGGRFLAEGRIIRSGDEGTAICFNQSLGWETLNFITGSSRVAATMLGGSLLGSYLDYFRINRFRTERDCQVAFGISCRTFARVTLATFLASIPLALLPVLVFREALLALPNWTKLLAGFSYGVVWLLVLQPLMDLTAFRLLHWMDDRLARDRRRPKP
jgi:hypothetical protein